eukprot:188398_1
MYIIETIIVFIILLIELKTFYYSTAHHNIITNMSKSNASSDQLPSSPSSVKSSHSTSSQKPNASTSSGAPVKKYTFILPILAYAFYVIAGICGVCTILGIQPCVVFGTAGPTTYILAKMFMYFVFIYRIYIVYSNSAFAYNNKWLLLFLIIVLTYSIMIIFVNALTLNISKYINANNRVVCTATGTKFVGAIGALSDTIISGLCCYLFIK